MLPVDHPDQLVEFLNQARHPLCLMEVLEAEQAGLRQKTAGIPAVVYSPIVPVPSFATNNTEWSLATSGLRDHHPPHRLWLIRLAA
jgi:hypothetical protein